MVFFWMSSLVFTVLLKQELVMGGHLAYRYDLMLLQRDEERLRSRDWK